jgi:octaprenyl-diphosphate synthase
MKEFQSQALELIQHYPESKYKEALVMMVNYVIDRNK